MQVAEFNTRSYGVNNLLLSVLIINILSVKVMWVTGKMGYLSIIQIQININRNQK